jgi:hypothetical protein
MTLRELGSLALNWSRYSLTVCFMGQKIWLCFPFKQPLPLRPLSCNIRSNGGREHASSLQIDEVPIRYGVLPVRLRKKLETFLQNTAEEIKRASRAQHIYFLHSRGLFVFRSEFEDSQNDAKQCNLYCDPTDLQDCWRNVGAIAGGQTPYMPMTQQIGVL